MKIIITIKPTARMTKSMGWDDNDLIITMIMRMKTVHAITNNKSYYHQCK